MIILNDVDLASEMLDTKGATCSNRPVLNMACELAGFKELTGFLMYGQRLKESRKFIHRAIGNRESLRMFDSLFEAEVRKYLKATLRHPDDIQEHIRRYKSRLLIFLIEGTDDHTALQVQSSFALPTVTKRRSKGTRSSRLQSLRWLVSRSSVNQEHI